MRIDDRLSSRQGYLYAPNLIDIGMGTVGGSTLLNNFYRDTPANVGVFAWTGGDLEHFCLLAIDGVICEDSPVIYTRPMAYENVVVGSDLIDFLRLGMHTGFTELLWNGFERHAAGHFAADVSDVQRSLLEILAKEFSLTPWKPDGGKRIRDLQRIRRQLTWDDPDAREMYQRELSDEEMNWLAPDRANLLAVCGADGDSSSWQWQYGVPST